MTKEKTAPRLFLSRLKRIVHRKIAGFLLWLAACFVAHDAARAADLYCWSPLTKGLGAQTQVEGAEGPAFAADGRSGKLWVAWAENDYSKFTGKMAVRQFDGKAWHAHSVSEPTGSKTGLYDPVLHVSTSGDSYLLWRSVPHLRSRITVARQSGDQWTVLGAPLGALPEAGADAKNATMAVDQQGRPVVAWQSKGNRSSSLVTARWDGDSWQMMGQPLGVGSELYSIRATLSLGASNDLWIAWLGGNESRPVPGLARWDGNTWRAISTASIVSNKRKGKVEGIRLAVLADRTVVLGWTEVSDGARPGSARARPVLNRWNGNAWETLAIPAAGAAPHVRDVQGLASTSDGGLLAALSDQDEAEVASGQVYRYDNGRWTLLLTGMRALPGSSSVYGISIVPTPTGGFYLSWDEVGGDEQRTRAVFANRCNEGEKPIVPPPVRAAWLDWPKTVDAAVEDLWAKLDDKAKAELRETPPGSLAKYHFGMGMWIRNNYGLWDKNDALRESCGNARIHPDECSGIIIERLWRRSQQPAVPSAR